ncbi:MAG: hypothetical protein AB7F59_02950 [Bdellovibrionales bacterium]
MKTIIFSALILVSTWSFAQEAKPKVRVRVEPTEDRWLTFMDGERLRHGVEVSHLVSETLYLTDRYLILTGSGGASLFSTQTFQAEERVDQVLQELAERLPGMEFTYLRDTQARSEISPLSSSSGDMSVFSQKEASVLMQAVSRREAQLFIRPRVETLLYASGERSNRAVYGFAPDRINPFNEGREGAKDNEFIKKPQLSAIPEESSGKLCSVVDFFSGQMEPEGFGPGRSNFGFDADEGVTFSILGYGFGFRKKTFEVKSEIVFEVEAPELNYKREYRFELKGSGRDLYIGAQYSGILVGVEIQKRKTLRQSLAQLLPTIVENFEKELPTVLWQTDITAKFDEAQWIIPGGFDEGLTEGMQLISGLGSVYTITKSFAQASLIRPESTNVYKPFVGEPLRFHVLGVNVWGEPEASFRTLAAVGDSSTQSISLGTKDLGQISLPEDVAPIANLCAGKQPGMIERWLMNILWVYGYIRYKTVLDQPFDSLDQKLSTQKLAALSAAPKIALIASGVSPKEEKLKSHLENSGFDFISWDKRPSDDLGMGTAAALLMEKQIKVPFTLVPLKVFGPRGDTHSATLYQALEYASKREDIQYVVVPFQPAIESEAYKMGLELCVRAGKKVFVASQSGVEGVIEAAESKDDYKVGGLGSKVRLAKAGRGVVEEFIKQLNQTNLKASKK